MNAMTKAIGTSAQTMTSVNNKLPIGEFAKTMRDFTYANDKMDMQSEMIEETLDSMLDTDQDEEDKIINQVLDEIGIEMNTKVFKKRTALFLKFIRIQKTKICRKSVSGNVQ